MAHRSSFIIQNSGVISNTKSVGGMDATRAENKASSVGTLMNNLGVTYGQFTQFLMIVLLVGAFGALYTVAKVPALLDKLISVQNTDKNSSSQKAPLDSTREISSRSSSSSTVSSRPMISAQSVIDNCASLAANVSFDRQIAAKQDCLRRFNGG